MKKFLWGLGIGLVLLASGAGYYTYQQHTEEQARESESDDDVTTSDLNDYTDEDDDDSDESSSESSDSESSDSESDSESSSENSESSSDESDSPETNLVYGKLDKSSMSDYVDNLHKNDSGAYQGEAGSMRVTIGVDSDKTIKVIEMSFPDSPMDLKLDASHIKDLVTQWMGTDATQTAAGSDGKSFTYQSASLGRAYNVDYTLNASGQLTEFHVRVAN